MRRDIVRIACVSWLTVLTACREPETREESGAREATMAEQTAPTPAEAPATPAAARPDAAVGKSVTVASPPNSTYSAGGAAALVDGKAGSDDFYDPAWLGWWYEDGPFEAVVDLGETVAIDSLGLQTLTCTESWIFYPRSVEFAVSSDGRTFENVATVRPTEAELREELPSTKILEASGLKRNARFVRVRAERYGELPDWHLGHGGADGYEGQAWLFVAEILVNPR